MPEYSNLLHSFGLSEKQIQIYNQNTKCYSLKVENFSSGLFDNCVDGCYILTMKNSKRIPKFMDQINLKPPMKQVIIQYNKGFKKCNKILNKNSTNYDLTDAYVNVFVDALKRGFLNVLVFEDDFIYEDFTKHDINLICRFLKNANWDVYNLGAYNCIDNNLLNSFRRDLIHINCDSSSSSHAVIYTQNYIIDFVRYGLEGKIKECDVFWNDKIWGYKKYNVYTYHKPIITQTIPVTDNFYNWNNGNKIINNYHKYKNKLLKLDKSTKNFGLLRKLQKVQLGIVLFLPIFFILIVIIIVSIILIKKRKLKNSP